MKNETHPPSPRVWYYCADRDNNLEQYRSKREQSEGDKAAAAAGDDAKARRDASRFYVRSKVIVTTRSELLAGRHDYIDACLLQRPLQQRTFLEISSFGEGVRVRKKNGDNATRCIRESVLWGHPLRKRDRFPTHAPT